MSTHQKFIGIVFCIYVAKGNKSHLISLFANIFR